LVISPHSHRFSVYLVARLRGLAPLVIPYVETVI
jgi:hypothetical protein